MDRKIAVFAGALTNLIVFRESNLFSELCVDALQNVKSIGSMGEYKYPVKAIKVVKAHGQSVLESRVVKGYAFQASRANMQMPQKITKAKIACLDINMQKFKLKFGISVQIDDPKNIEKIRQR